MIITLYIEALAWVAKINVTVSKYRQGFELPQDPGRPPSSSVHAHQYPLSSTLAEYAAVHHLVY